MFFEFRNRRTRVRVVAICHNVPLVGPRNRLQNLGMHPGIIVAGKVASRLCSEAGGIRNQCSRVLSWQCSDTVDGIRIRTRAIPSGAVFQAKSQGVSRAAIGAHSDPRITMPFLTLEGVHVNLKVMRRYLTILLLSALAAAPSPLKPPSRKPRAISTPSCTSRLCCSPFCTTCPKGETCTITSMAPSTPKT